MKGIRAKIITDDETVRMHTNFADSNDSKVFSYESGNCTWSNEDGVLKVHTNTIKKWVFAFCEIPNILLEAGQKYGISVRSNKHISISLSNPEGSHKGTFIVNSQWDGEKASAVVMLKEEDVVDGLGLYSWLGSNTDYEIRDFRIWKIDDLGGGQ